MSNLIWLNDPTILLKHNKLNELWPKSKMTTEEKINAITRLILLLTFLGYLLTLSIKIFYIGFITLASIIVLYLVQNRSSSKNLDIKEAFTNNLSSDYELNKNNFTKPSATNPLMNVLIPEILYDPKRKPAAPAFNPVVEEDINKSVKEFIEKPFNDKNIGKKLFSDLGDDMMFNRSMLPWSATANTQVPSDLNAYKEFVYGDMISGKEGNPHALERHSSGAHNYINP